MDDMESVFEKLKGASEIVDDVSNDYWGFRNFQRLQCACGYIGDAISLLKRQEPRVKDQKEATALQGFLLDIPSSESILNSVNCHAISLEDASRIIAICAFACDAMSPSGFIRWLKERFKQDLVLRGYVE